MPFFAHDVSDCHSLVRWFVGCGAALATGAAVAAVSEPPADPMKARTTLGDDSWTVKRVGGDLNQQVQKIPAGFRSGTARFTTPLPQGYPDPTPPGSIDLKKYPAARRAQVTSSADSNVGSNMAFWPLFQHIKKHDIEMTSPVEMDFTFEDLKTAENGAEPNADAEGSKPAVKSAVAVPKTWTMSFLYRTPDMNKVGTEGAVKVVDREPVMVLSVGLQGPYGTVIVSRGVEKLTEWLVANAQWERAGEPRAFYYNGPEARNADKWAEVQLPVRRVAGNVPTAGLVEEKAERK
mgnify:CR=1 FL=1